MLRWVPRLTFALMLAPVVAGLAGTLAPAFGWLPALGGERPGLTAFASLLGWPGLARAVMLSATTGIGATLLSLVLAAVICAGWQGTRVFRMIEHTLSPMLAVPHAAAAFGMAFLIAPSGWLVRLLSPWATGWDRPPDLLIVQDPSGLALMFGLVIKELPFLLLMTFGAIGQLRASESHAVARALGYRRVSSWMKIIFPRVYAQIRLPVYAVLAFSTSVVDVAIILGPNTPPTLSVQVVRWMNDPDLALRFQAAAGAVVQLLLVLGILGLWRVGELAVATVGRRWINRGGRGHLDPGTRALGLGVAGTAAVTITLGLGGLAMWSVAGLWQFPRVLPDAFTLRSWQRIGPDLVDPASDTVLIAVLATVVALVLGLACLEAEYRHRPLMPTRWFWLVYVPLLVPQVAFLTGLQTLALSAGVDANRMAVVIAHLVFVLPYVLLSLADPFRSWDHRYARVAGALGASPSRVFWTVRLPMLFRPVLTALAVGVAVSVGQYLPTLLVGAGRVQTLTTEAVALASSGDRRVIGIYALAQTGAALVPFVMAVVLPRLLWRNRRVLRDG